MWWLQWLLFTYFSYSSIQCLHVTWTASSVFVSAWSLKKYVCIWFITFGGQLSPVTCSFNVSQSIYVEEGGRGGWRGPGDQKINFLWHFRSTFNQLTVYCFSSLPSLFTPTHTNRLQLHARSALRFLWWCRNYSTARGCREDVFGRSQELSAKINVFPLDGGTRCESGVQSWPRKHTQRDASSHRHTTSGL